MTSREFDACVVGTGPSALSVVESLLRRDETLSVLVLEAGTSRFSDSDVGNRASVGLPFRLRPTINIGYGGTSQLWHNVLAPLDKEDGQASYFSAAGDWPITFSDLEPHYRQIAEFFGFDFDLFDQPGAFFDYESQLNNVHFDRKIFSPKIFVQPRKYLRSDRDFSALDRKYGNLSICLGERVVRFRERNGIVEVSSLGRASTEITTWKTRVLVLSCGALNNPQIIFNSFDGSPDLELLGKCLMDHPMGNMFQFKYPSSKRTQIYSNHKLNPQLNIKAALRPTLPIQRQYGIGNSAFYLRPSFAEGPQNQTEELKLRLLTARKRLFNFDFPFYEACGLLRDANLVRQIIQYKTGFSSAHRLTECMFVTEQEPSLASRVYPNGIVDRFGIEGTDVDWRLSARDLNQVQVLGSLIEDAVCAPNNAPMTFDRNLVAWNRRLSSAAHHLGTVRMSINDTSGCVDASLKLYNTESVYVCDGSVFPTSGNANPTLTCMALGNRLGEHLTHA